MSNYTKDLWIAVGGMVEVEGDDVADICSCHPENFGQGHLTRSREEVHANAKLIAQAPNMAMVLKDLLKTFCDDPRWDGVPIIDEAKTILYDATGEEL